jgi:hypothetical protein
MNQAINVNRESVEISGTPIRPRSQAIIATKAGPEWPQFMASLTRS